MTLAGVIGSIIAVLGGVAAVYRIYISWEARNHAKRDIEKANDVAAKNKREAEIHSQAKRSKHDVADKLRELRKD